MGAIVSRKKKKRRAPEPPQQLNQPQQYIPQHRQSEVCSVDAVDTPFPPLVVPYQEERPEVQPGKENEDDYEVPVHPSKEVSSPDDDESPEVERPEVQLGKENDDHYEVPVHPSKEEEVSSPDNDERPDEEENVGQEEDNEENEGELPDWAGCEGDDDNEEEEEEKEYTPAIEMLEQILRGDIDIELPSQVRIVRIFTSSTFTDTYNERNTLMVKVYPKLKEYCQSQGFDFQVVDMRWGIRDEATADHMTSELCMRELKACQNLSTGPNFITFLGQKYGYRPFPPKIAAAELDAMLEVIANTKDRDLLMKWFLLDYNMIPPTYILQPITDRLPNYNNQSVSKEERSQASNDWWTAFERMQVVFRQASSKVFKHAKNVMRKYYMSVTEDEISRGILKAREPIKHCYWFKRNINDIEDYIDNENNTRNFIDKQGPKLDKEAYNFVDQLRSDKLPKILPQENISVYDVRWHGDKGIDPDASNQHSAYLHILCKDFYRILVKMIEDGIEERKTLDIDDNLVKEICQHASTCQDKSRIFHGREDVLESIAKYLEDTSTEENKPLVVHGTSGCGKTAIMAKAASLAKSKHEDRIQVTRFLGTTSDSSTLAKLLYSICCHIKRANGVSSDTVPRSAKQLTDYMKDMFADIMEKQTDPVIIFLDSIDQLAPDDGAHLMKWLPKQLPKCVKMVISTLPDEQYQILQTLKFVLPDESFVKVPTLPITTANDILSAWLSDGSRTITEEQTETVMTAFNHCPLPLFLKLCFDEAVRWKSYTDPKDTVLQTNVKDAINTLFERLERLHGKTLVSHALGLITSSKHGLADAEIDEVLSIDDEVLNDVYQYWTPPVRRIPPLLWVRIRADLGSYIVSRGANGSLVNMWYHRQFIETATERYLLMKEKKDYHTLLSEYFLGTWSNNRKKPFVSRNGDAGESNRLVAAQPNVYKKQDGTEGVFNYRKLSELPRHLIASENIEALKTEVVFNFDFLLSKLRAFGYQYLLEDCSEATEMFPEDKEIKLLYEFLKMSGRTLLRDPNQLPCQLVGRMYDMKQKSIINLLNEARIANVPCMYPSMRCFDAPGGPIMHSLAGHTQAVNYAAVSLDKKQLLSVSNDSSLRIWDLSSGRQIRSIELEESMNMVFPFFDDVSVILTSYSKVWAHNLQTEEVYYSEYHSTQYGSSADLTKDRKHFLILGNEEITVFDCQERQLKVKFKIKDKAGENSDGFIDILTASHQQFVYSRSNKNKFYIRDVDDETSKKTMKSPSEMVFFTFTPDGNKFILLACPTPVTESNKQMYLHVYDVSSWQLLKTLKSNDSHLVIYVTNVSVHGDELIWPTMMQINFWNIETGQERHALKQGYQGNQYKQAICPDDNSMAVVSMDMNNTAIQVYNTEAIEYTEVTADSKNRSDIEKARAYVGKGEREMYLHPSESVGVSIPPMDPYLTLWDTKTYKKIKKIVTKDVFATAIKFIDDERMALWDHNKKCVLVLDYMQGKFITATSKESISDYPPSLYMNTWVICEETDELLMFDPGRKYFKFYNLKTGQESAELKTNWKMQGQHILANRDGSIILSCEYDVTDYTKSPPLMLFDTSKRVKIGEIIPAGRTDMRPEVSILTEDAKYFICTNQNLNGVDVWDMHKLKLVTTIDYDITKDMKATINSLSASMKMGCLIICYSAGEFINGQYINFYLLVAYKLHTWEQITKRKTGGMVSRFEYSNDQTRFLTNMHASGGDSVKTLDLYDISGLCDEGQITKVASFMPETDTRFCYLSKDGLSICVGLSGIDGVTFFRPCGTGLVNVLATDVIELDVECPFYPTPPQEKK